MIAGIVEIGRGDRRGGKHVEKEGKSRARERESIRKSNKKSSEIWPGSADRGGGRSASAAVPGGRCENTVVRGLRLAQVPRPFLDPQTAESEKSPSRMPRDCRWESWVGILFFRSVIAGGRLRSSSCEPVVHWISVPYRIFCVEVSPEMSGEP
jgi:hypothetical protein